jgi:hypothetical protein
MQTTLIAPGEHNVGAGMPGDRRARAAANQAFTDLKQTFLYVLADATGADRVRRQVEQAEEPLDLWRLRAPAFAVLDGVDLDQRGRRQLLRRGLDTLFPEDEVLGSTSPS